ncbi:MAG: ComEC/Rec2 family competence protein [Candidatus Dormibacteraeota bacterium]|nr:ComEC/Rec2 family competence protein [Candidatus Dormibacteraeota bacterium]
MNAAAPWRVALCAGAFSACVGLTALDARLAVIVAVVSCTVILLTQADWRFITSCVAIAACCLGSWRALSALAVDHGPNSLAGHLGTGAVVLRGTVGDSGVPGRVDTFVVDVHQVVTRAGTWSVTGSVVVEPLHPVALLPGDSVDVATTSLRAPPQRRGSLSAASLERVGVTAIATAAQVTALATGGPTPARLAQQARRLLTAAVTRVLPEPEATLLLGIAFGVHGTLATAVRAPLQDAGLIHIVAVSGLKVAMIAGLINAVGRRRGWSRRRRSLVTLAVIAMYVGLSGAGAAALRSSLMVVAGLLLTRDGRRPHSFALLGVCAALMLAVEPTVATDVGFQLSFLGTAGILLLAAPIARRLPGPRLLAEPFAVTVAAQLATAPVTAGTFGVLSLVGPFANAVTLPLLPLIIVVGGSGAVLTSVVPALGWLPLETGALLCGAVLAVAQGATALPFAAVHLQLWPGQWTLVELTAVTAGGLAWCLHARKGGPPALVLVTVTVAAVVAGAASTTVAAAVTARAWSVTVLDVGNSVAVLIRPPRGGLVLVDGGSDGTALLTALGRALSPLDRHLDAVVLTATDRTSSAAIPALLGRYDVGTMVVAQVLPPALQSVAAAMAGTGTRIVVAGTTPWSLGAMTMRCLPTGPALGAPCVLQLGDARSTALITGNLTQSAQDELTGVQGSRLRADLLVGPVTTAPSAALVAAVQPALVAVPARRSPPGLGSISAQFAVTGRDGDLVYDALPTGGYADPTG